MPALFQPQRPRLGFQVGELPAGHLVQIDFRSGRRDARLEGRILAAHRLPIVRNLPHSAHVDAGVALGMFQSLDNRAEAGLRSAARKRIHRRIDRVDASIRRSQNRCRCGTAGVMGVKVDR